MQQLRVIGFGVRGSRFGVLVLQVAAVLSLASAVLEFDGSTFSHPKVQGSTF